MHNTSRNFALAKSSEVGSESLHKLNFQQGHGRSTVDELAIGGLNGDR